MYIKPLIWDITERFPLDVLEITDAFSMFDLEKVHIHFSSNKFSVHACNDVEVL